MNILTESDPAPCMRPGYRTRRRGRRPGRRLQEQGVWSHVGVSVFHHDGFQGMIGRNVLDSDFSGSGIYLFTIRKATNETKN